MLKIISLLIIIGLNFSCLKPKIDKFQANKGVIDLRNWNFERDGILKLDGEWEFYHGEVGKSRETSIPSRENRIIKINTISETVEVLLHVSNFNYNVGGLWRSIFFGTYDDVYDYRDLHVFQDIFLSGLLAFMGFYHLGLYSVRTKERSAFICLIFSNGLQPIFGFEKKILS